MREYLIVGNWKMNPETLPKAVTLAKGVVTQAAKLKKTSVVYCPPTPFLSSVLKHKRKEVFIGAQDVFFERSGAFTGSVAPGMLKSVGATYVIVGHSERRGLGETNEMVGKKAAAALSAGIRPVVCVGERERDPEGWHLSGVRDQLEAVFEVIPKQKAAQVIVAYEPVWAIGKDAVRQATPAESTEMVIFIRKVLADLLGASIASKIMMLYGGSVDEKNAPSFITDGSVKGLLVGRTSLDKGAFGKLLAAVDSL